MCLGIYCLWSVAYTSVNVPYGSMQSCITNDPDGRSALSTWRSIGAMCAQIPIMILLPLLVYDKNDNPRGELFIVFVGVMGAIGLVSFWLLRRMTTERLAPAVASEKQKFNYFATLKSFFKNKPMMGATISTVAYLSWLYQGEGNKENVSSRKDKRLMLSSLTDNNTSLFFYSIGFFIHSAFFTPIRTKPSSLHLHQRNP